MRSNGFNRNSDGSYVNGTGLVVWRPYGRWTLAAIVSVDGIGRNVTIREFKTLGEATAYGAKLAAHPDATELAKAYGALSRATIGIAGHGRRARMNERIDALLAMWESGSGAFGIGADGLAYVVSEREQSAGNAEVIAAGGIVIDTSKGEATNKGEAMTPEENDASALARHYADNPSERYQVQRLHSGSEDGPLWYVVDMLTGERGDGGWIHREDAEGEKREALGLDFLPADALADIAAHVLDMREIESGEGGADAREAYARELAKLRDMLAALDVPILLDVPEATLELAGEDYAALAAVWASLWRAGIDAVYMSGTMANGDSMPLTAAEGAIVASWAREFASDCVWADADAETIEDMSVRTVISCAARKYDGGIVGMCRDALALPRAMDTANAHAAKLTVYTNPHGLHRLTERERFAAAAKLADDSIPAMLARCQDQGMDATETPRELARDIADVLADTSALGTSALVSGLDSFMLQHVADMLREGLATIDNATHDYIVATADAAKLAALAGTYRGRGDDWQEIERCLDNAANHARMIARACRQVMRENEANYFSAE